MHWKLRNAKDKLRPKYTHKWKDITGHRPSRINTLDVRSRNASWLRDNSSDAHPGGVRFERRVSLRKSSVVFFSTFRKITTVATSNDSVVKGTVRGGGGGGWTKPRCRIVVATKFCTGPPHICRSSVWTLLHIALLAPRILRKPRVLKNLYSHKIYQPVSNRTIRHCREPYLSTSSLQNLFLFYTLILSFHRFLRLPSCPFPTGISTRTNCEPIRIFHLSPKFSLTWRPKSDYPSSGVRKSWAPDRPPGGRYFVVWRLICPP
jgi:hypothetical protein